MRNGHYIYSSGDQCWYHNDKFHRTDGPAIIYSNGTQLWYLNDLLHNLFGPAIIWNNGKKSYYLNGIEFTYTDWLNQIQFKNLESIL